MANQTHLDKLLAGVRPWNRWRLDNPTLRPDLGGADLAGRNLNRADLRGVDLRRANLFQADLSRADLRGARLRQADLRRARLVKANLRGADLSEVDLGRADLRGADFRRNDPWAIDLKQILRAVVLVGSVFFAADLFRTHFAGADLLGAFLLGTALWVVSMIVLRLNDGVAALFSFIGTAQLGAILWGFDLWGAWPSGVVLLAAVLWGVGDLRSLLQGPIQQGANLQGANLLEANLRRANLTEADVSRAYLRGGILDEANLRQVKYDAQTIWPGGFTPPQTVTRLTQG